MTNNNKTKGKNNKSNNISNSDEHNYNHTGDGNYKYTTTVSSNDSCTRIHKHDPPYVTTCHTTVATATNMIFRQILISIKYALNMYSR